MATKATTKQAPKQVRVTAKDIAAVRTRAARDTSPNWAGAETWSGEQFASYFRHAMKYYNTESNGKALKPQVINWMAKNEYTKQQIALFKKTKDWRCTTTVGAVAACLNKGMPPSHSGFNNGKDSALWLKSQIAEIMRQGRNDIDEEAAAQEAKEAQPAVPTASIQERTRDAAMTMTAEIEDALEKFHADPEAWNPKEFKILNLLRNKGCKAAHARIIKDFYAKPLAELSELISPKCDPQLKEGYAHIARKHVKKLIDFYTEIEAACSMLLEEAKVVRAVRTPRAVDKNKLVSKLKFKAQDDVLKLVSVNPLTVLGAKALWVYNTKTRKIGKYVAQEGQELSVKGTTLLNFNEELSIQKTLRKPAEQIKLFKEAGKIALRKFMETINSVDTKMNGRISEDIVLLKVE